MGADPALDPIPELGDMDHFSARWEGFVKTGDAGEYTFIVSGDDGFRLFINGENIISDWKSRAEATASAKVKLPADTLVPVKLEYFQSLYGAKVALRWVKPTEIAQPSAVRRVVLPAGAEWYDFWTGAKSAGGQTLNLAVPLSSMPLFVRAGSILPFGPALQHTAEKSAQPVELRVYPGANAEFALYDDAGDGYGYEKGEHATIQLTWDDKAETLTIGSRQGRYPGMPEKQAFLVRILKPGGLWKDTLVDYIGQGVTVK